MLTARDREIVRWIGRHGVVRAEHVMTRFSLGRTTTYRRVHELVECGLIRRHRVLYNHGGLLTASADGLRWSGLDRLRPARISLGLVTHMIASTELAVRLEPQLFGETLLSDREHRALEDATGRLVASAVMGPSRSEFRRLHRPDLALIRADGERAIAIEVELTLKTRTRLERILRGYLRNRNLSAVRYYAPPQIADAVQRAARAVGADRLVELVPLPTGMPFGNLRGSR